MITTKSGKKYFNYGEVSEILGVCVETVRRYSRALGMSLYGNGGRMYFDESQIVKLVEWREKTSTNTRGKTRKKS